MKARLYVRGMKEPIELESEEGIAAQALISSPLPSDTPFSIEGVWTGKKAEMKFVVFDKVDRSRPTGKTEPMSKQEATEFEAEVEPYKRMAVEQGQPEFFYIEFYMEAKKIVNLIPYESPLRVARKKRFSISVIDTERYAAVRDRYERYIMFKDRVAFVKGKELKELQKTADSIGQI